ncbi:putative polysaccharide deacetylase [Lyophyllum shimeji]|uniref:Polysaccharide deacetylase n=1 Tax=Lyophyllum shimeji TaxID=47721 RepID=A0A9P3PRM9_LYOSH|nr:putative polysaccharide deacetylase [Lyophyllum shimeji]
MLFSAIVVLGLSVTGLAAPQPEKRARAQVITHCTVPNTAALTFDDGPYLYLYDISKTLKAAGAKGTFFFNGNNYGCIYSDDNAKRVKYAYDQGHQVASHTWAHKDLTTLTWDQIHDEMWRVELALRRITGAYPAFMRPHTLLASLSMEPPDRPTITQLRRDLGFRLWRFTRPQRGSAESRLQCPCYAPPQHDSRAQPRSPRVHPLRDPPLRDQQAPERRLQAGDLGRVPRQARVPERRRSIRSHC